MITVKAQGSTPTTSSLATEKQLLIAAWAYGLKAGEGIHRFSLYAFIQSHLENKTEETLQRVLETNGRNWKARGRRGIYTLTDSGYRQLSEYGIPNLLIPLKSLFTFSRTIDHYTISVTVDPTRSQYIVKQNGDDTKANTIIHNIENVTSERIETKRTSRPRRIMNWILSDKYYWKIEDFKDPQISISEPIVEENKDEKQQSEIIKGFRNDENSMQEIITELQNLNETDPEVVTINGKKYKRDNKTIAQIKFIRGFKCQICEKSIRKKDGSDYVEAAHIKPKNENGRETLDNIILLCPNHHKEFDIGVREIISQDSKQIVFTLNGEEHTINLQI